MSDLNVVTSALGSPTVTLHVSSVQKLINAGIEVYEYQQELSALKVIAATRPLTKDEAMRMEEVEFNLENNLEVLRHNASHFAEMQAAA